MANFRATYASNGGVDVTHNLVGVSATRFDIGSDVPGFQYLTSARNYLIIIRLGNIVARKISDDSIVWIATVYEIHAPGLRYNNNTTEYVNAVLYDYNIYLIPDHPYTCFYVYGNDSHMSLLYGIDAAKKILDAYWSQTGTTQSQYYAESVRINYLPQYIMNNLTSFHTDPVYVEATKLKYTDGTYNFIRGAATADRARKAAYNSLLKSYGTFYKGTEKELAECFANTIDQSSS